MIGVVHAKGSLEVALPPNASVVAVALVTVGGRRTGRCCLRAWDGWGRMS